MHGLAPIPKLEIKEGEAVLAGQPVFFDMSLPDVHFCSPVSGEAVEIRRGAKRAIDEIVILADSTIVFREFPRIDPGLASREQIAERLLQAGAWALIRQRPSTSSPIRELRRATSSCPASTRRRWRPAPIF
jgi:Na+-transporting NADH:ubiquinone oxidoreductase subunit A